MGFKKLITLIFILLFSLNCLGETKTKVDVLNLRATTLPATGTLGDVRLDTATNSLNFWNGTNWRAFGGSTYTEVIMTGREVTVTSDTHVQTTQSITLAPGTWLIGFNLTARIDNESGAEQQVGGAFALHDGSAVVADSESYFSAYVPAAASEFYPASNQTIVTITSSTTYKIDIVCTKTDTSGRIRLEDADLSGTITGDDNAPRLWARKL